VVYSEQPIQILVISVRLQISLYQCLLLIRYVICTLLPDTQACCRYAKLTAGSGSNGAWGVSAAVVCSRWSVGVYNTVHSLIIRTVRDTFWRGVEWTHLRCCCSCSSRLALQLTFVQHCPLLKGAWVGWGEYQYRTSHAAASDGFASPAKKGNTNVSGLSPLDV